MKHVALIGIEHLMTGVQMGGESDGQSFTFERESATVVKVISDEPFNLYWPVNQATINSHEAEITPSKYSTGDAEWYAQGLCPAIVQYERRRDSAYYGKTEPFTPAVSAAVIRRWGINAPLVFKAMQWDGLCKCWMVPWAGMLLGIEQDGYIHS